MFRRHGLNRWINSGIGWQRTASISGRKTTYWFEFPDTYLEERSLQNGEHTETPDHRRQWTPDQYPVGAGYVAGVGGDRRAEKSDHQ